MQTSNESKPATAMLYLCPPSKERGHDYYLGDQAWDARDYANQKGIRIGRVVKEYNDYAGTPPASRRYLRDVLYGARPTETKLIVSRYECLSPNPFAVISTLIQLKRQGLDVEVVHYPELDSDMYTALYHAGVLSNKVERKLTARERLDVWRQRFSVAKHPEKLANKEDLVGNR